MTGIRSWIAPTSSLAVVVMRQQVRSFCPSPFHTSHKPANANGSPDTSVNRCGNFFFPWDFHS